MTDIADYQNQQQHIVEEPHLFYRYEDVQYAPPPDEWGDCYGLGRLEVVLRKYDVIKRTPKGCWIGYSSFGWKRFVLDAAKKRFACATIEEAKQSFVARKTRQIHIYEAKLTRARKVLALVQNTKSMALL